MCFQSLQGPATLPRYCCSPPVASFQSIPLYINIHKLQYKMCISTLFIRYQPYIGTPILLHFKEYSNRLITYCISQRVDAEMKPFCMCVLSLVCFEGRRPPCPTSLLSVKLGFVEPLTTRRDRTVIL